MTAALREITEAFRRFLGGFRRTTHHRPHGTAPRIVALVPALRFEAMAVGCNIACMNATEDRCECPCGGRYHGRGA